MDAVDVIADQFAIIDERYGRKAAEACLAALAAAGWAVVPRDEIDRLNRIIDALQQAQRRD